MAKNVKADNGQTARTTVLALQRAVWLAAIYVALIFLLPANRETMKAFHLSPLGYRTALLTVTLPLIASWLVAFAGYARLREYVLLVRRAPEGTHLDKLATGNTWLAWSLTVPAIIALLLNALGNQWPVFYPASVIITNYLNLLFALVAFSIIGIASRGLVNRADLKFSLVTSRVIVLSFLTA